jgi:ABC-type uncharacterized transport system substrate-binding protein
MKRRDFIALLGGTAVAWPLAARAQQSDRVRLIGVLMGYQENDPAGQRRAIVFQEGLEKLGWAIGRNLQIHYKWGVGDSDWTQSAAVELVRLAPDVILANGGSAARPIQRATRSVPIILITGGDPVADGFVQSLAHPGGNITGFTVLESSVGAKLLELLKEIAPRTARVAVIINPSSPSSLRLSESASAAAQNLAVEVIVVPARQPDEIEAAITRLGRQSGNGLIVPPDPSTNTHRKLIVELAARHRLPTIYALRVATEEGGLMSYGVDLPDLFRQAATYADRILRGEKPADLPMQQPTRFELVVNLKTAKTLGLEVPPTLLALADEVIE